jgi:hypothetical protein
LGQDLEIAPTLFLELRHDRGSISSSALIARAEESNNADICVASSIPADIGTGGNPKMKINLADEIEQVTVAIDQTGKNGFAIDVDDTSTTGIVTPPRLPTDSPPGATMITC